MNLNGKMMMFWRAIKKNTRNTNRIGPSGVPTDKEIFHRNFYDRDARESSGEIEMAFFRFVTV